MLKQFLQPKEGLIGSGVIQLNIVIGTIIAIAEMNLPVNLSVIVPACENRPSSTGEFIMRSLPQNI